MNAKVICTHDKHPYQTPQTRFASYMRIRSLKDNQVMILHALELVSAAQA